MESVTLNGWTLSSSRRPILGERDLEAVDAALGGVVSLPEQLFGHNCVDFHHVKTGISINLNALDALRGWREESVPPLRLPGAREWLSSRMKEVKANNADYLEYDWTFTTPYRGTICSADLAAAGFCGRSLLLDPHPGRGTLEAHWTPTEDTIDRQMLMARDPLLFFDEVVLYESELDDNGVSNYTVKVRASERCWFALARFYLRVDNTLVRLREVRLFCRLDQPDVVLREVTHREGTMQELAAGGAPAQDKAYADADSAAVALQAVAPVGVKLFLTEKLDLSVATEQNCA